VKSFLLVGCALAGVFSGLVQGAYTLWTGQNRSVWSRLAARRPSSTAPKLSARIIGGTILFVSFFFLIILLTHIKELAH